MNDTGYRKLNIIGGDGDRDAHAKVDMATGLETQPCFLCKSWEKDEKKLAEHFMSHGLFIEPDGTIKTPIAKDFPGRPSMTLKLQEMGWCRKEARPTQDLATCSAFAQVQNRADMQARLSLMDRLKK